MSQEDIGMVERFCIPQIEFGLNHIVNNTQALANPTGQINSDYFALQLVQWLSFAIRI